MVGLGDWYPNCTELKLAQGEMNRVKFTVQIRRMGLRSRGRLVVALLPRAGWEHLGLRLIRHTAAMIGLRHRRSTLVF